jgi:hypothetical protein
MQKHDKTSYKAYLRGMTKEEFKAECQVVFEQNDPFLFELCRQEGMIRGTVFVVFHGEIVFSN